MTPPLSPRAKKPSSTVQGLQLSELHCLNFVLDGSCESELKVQVPVFSVDVVTVAFLRTHNKSMNILFCRMGTLCSFNRPYAQEDQKLKNQKEEQECRARTAKEGGEEIPELPNLRRVSSTHMQRETETKTFLREPS